MPRFVVLTHDHPMLHWDFMLEMGAALRTWRLPEPPRAGCELPVEPLPDHRLMYLDYEGPVSGNRGSVRRWDAGSFEILEESPERLVVQLAGTLLHGDVRMEQKNSDEWTMFHFPARASSGDGISRNPSHTASPPCTTESNGLTPA